MKEIVLSNLVHLHSHFNTTNSA